MKRNAKRKKVLFIITKSNYGGAQRYVFDLATSIPKDHFDVSVALGGTGLPGDPPGMLQKNLAKQGVRTITVKHFTRDMSFRNDVAVFFEIFNIIRVEKPDVLHVTSSKAGGLGALIGRIAGVPNIIFTSHGLAYDERWRPYLERQLIKVATWVTMMLAKKTIQITRDTRERASSLPFLKNKVFLIHNGIEPPRFMDTGGARAHLSPETKEEVIWIGALAELTINKNLHVLIETIASMREKSIPVHLFICGAGEEKNRLLSLVKDLDVSAHVHLLGYVPDAATYLKAFDIFVLPSLKEGLPYVLLEAGHASLAVVASDIPGISDILTHGKTGLMVTPTREGLEEALSGLVFDEEARVHYGAALKKHVEESFSIKKMVEETVLLY